MNSLTQGLLASVLLVSSAHVAAEDFFLDFNATSACGAATCQNGSFIDPTYGDVPDFLDIEYVDVGSNTSLRWWDQSYNDLQGVVWASGGDASSHGRIVINRGWAWNVVLNSLDLGAYPQTTLGTHFSVKTLAGDVLYSYEGNVGAGATQHTHLVPNISSAGGLIIEWKNSAYNVGVDNVNFSVTPVPEPESYAMFLAGIGILGAVARRRQAV